MAGNVASEISVAQNGSVSIAPLSDSLMYPELVDDQLDTPFVDLGYVDSDGVTFTVAPNVEDITAWQSSVPVRRLVTSRAMTAKCNLEQFNQQSFSVAFGGGNWTHEPGGSHRYDPPTDTAALSEFAIVIDAQDGEKAQRWVIMRAVVTESVETNLNRSGASVLPVTFSALAPEGQESDTAAWYFLSTEFDSAS